MHRWKEPSKSFKRDKVLKPCTFRIITSVTLLLVLVFVYLDISNFNGGAMLIAYGLKGTFNSSPNLLKKALDV
jgi:hypothetical protein